MSETTWDGVERRKMTSEENMFSLISERMKILHGDVSDVKASVNELTKAITKLALIEDRQSQYALALERAFESIKELEARTSALETQSPASKRVSSLIDMALIGAIVVVVGFVLKHVGVV